MARVLFEIVAKREEGAEEVTFTTKFPNAIDTIEAFKVLGMTISGVMQTAVKSSGPQGHERESGAGGDGFATRQRGHTVLRPRSSAGRTCKGLATSSPAKPSSGRTRRKTGVRVKGR